MTAIESLKEESQNEYTSECFKAYVTTDGMKCIVAIE